jgi:hypothetical protein
VKKIIARLLMATICTLGLLAVVASPASAGGHFSGETALTAEQTAVTAGHASGEAEASTEPPCQHTAVTVSGMQWDDDLHETIQFSGTQHVGFTRCHDINAQGIRNNAHCANMRVRFLTAENKWALKATAWQWVCSITAIVKVYGPVTNNTDYRYETWRAGNPLGFTSVD